MDLLSHHPVLVSLFAILATLVAYGFTRLYQARMIVIKLKRQGLPVAPGHNFFLGHLLLLKKYAERLPKDAHYQYMFGEIYRDHFEKEGAFFIDLWPMTGLCYAVFSPHVAAAVMQNPNLSMQRPYLLSRFFKPIAGGPNLFDMKEADWRPWRTVFSKGFNGLGLVPGVVEETQVYAQTFRDLARKKERFSLDMVSLRFLMDVTGRTILNAELGAQKGYNTLADSMISQIRWHQPNAEINPLSFLNVARWYMEWRNGRAMDKYIGKELDRRYAELKADSDNLRAKAVIDIVLQAYIGDGKAAAKPEKLDPEFRAFAIRQIRLFVFGGHDSTSATLCYILHLLSKNPIALEKIRAEHDTVLGVDYAAVSDKLISHPQLANNLLYTTAVIKETLRLFPPASGARQGKPNTTVPTDAGDQCPMDDAWIFFIHVAAHRAPAYWVRAAEFLPERFLVEPGHELYPVKRAWRAFEHGPRSCIAQSLAMTDLKVILAHIVREFDFQDAYEEWDSMHGRKDFREVYGDRAYQIEEGSAHPSDHYPCRVSLRG
ncbi:putative sterigmatocystin biosynthesis P450 monooxygenase [Lachnellula arida]|uniref:Putative sterigmatocystin biosynthesis P450 monooxygenase n=1 Tax=Lachnellula arida TaxID=1316785 RepID=A0A8T9BE25_9HELO|nr:putative sterigmatocystin biosynthesis P450 monooxygenase [Lachnellula arida]